MPEFLLELGTEELPAHSVRRAYQELGEKLKTVLVEHSLVDSEIPVVSLGTPRRLIVCMDGVRAIQDDFIKEQRGPGLKSAYDADGKPTQALLGFCRGQGVDVANLRQDGQYVWVNKTVKGLPTTEILAAQLPNLIKSLTFDKTMRWGSGKLRFARPIRWLLALFDGEVVPFEIEGVRSDRLSHGHRFYAPGTFAVTDFSSLVSGLRERRVEPDPACREEMIVKHLPLQKGGHAEVSPELLDENVFLNEWPTPILGAFDSQFLELPGSVLATVMAKHEKMFPVTDQEGNVANQFIFVRNSGEDESVRKGCEWVLNARMNDAKFFYDEDRRFGIYDFREKTKGIVFQEKLGTVYDRSERLGSFAAFLAISAHENEKSFAQLAGTLCKADLASGLVSELTSLQGIIGADYARRESIPEEVCWAIQTQYDPGANLNRGDLGAPDNLKARTAVRLLIADQLDKLVGYLGIGLEPTGSSDPFGLRRAVSILIEVAWSWPTGLPSYSWLALEAVNLYQEEQGISLDWAAGEQALCRMFAARYVALLPKVRHDILTASLLPENPGDLTDPQAVRFRTLLMQELAQDEGFVQTATRPLNIESAARKKDIDFAEWSITNIDSESGVALHAHCQQIQDRLKDLVAKTDIEGSLEMLKSLEGLIHRFFEETMIMAEEEKMRSARLGLVSKVSSLLRLAGDFSQIVFEGQRR